MLRAKPLKSRHERTREPRFFAGGLHNPADEIGGAFLGTTSSGVVRRSTWDARRAASGFVAQVALG